MKKTIFNSVFLVVVSVIAVWFNLEIENEPEVGMEHSFGNYILAISWQPAFCEHLPNKPECRSQRKDRYDTKNFSLHGLWPQPRNNVYCNLPTSLIKTDKRGDWRQLPRLELDEKFRKELAEKMPGYRSFLHRHEWYKHGSCLTAATAESYFNISLDVLDKLNSSDLKKVILENVGREVHIRDLSRAFATAFGKDAESRISMICRRDGARTLITELRISLSAVDVSELVNLNKSIMKAPEISSSCKRGVVDPFGLQ